MGAGIERIVDIVDIAAPAQGMWVVHGDAGIGNEYYVDVDTFNEAEPATVENGQIVDDGTLTPDQVAARQLGDYPSAFDNPLTAGSESAHREQQAIRAAAQAREEQQAAEAKARKAVSNAFEN